MTVFLLHDLPQVVDNESPPGDGSIKVWNPFETEVDSNGHTARSQPSSSNSCLQLSAAGLLAAGVGLFAVVAGWWSTSAP